VPELVASWRRVPVLVQDLLVASCVLVTWAAATEWLRGDDWLPAIPRSHVVAMWFTVLAFAFRRTAPVPVLLGAVLAYPIAYEWWLQTEFHLLPILVAGYTAACSGKVPPVLVGVLCLGASADLYNLLPVDGIPLSLSDRLSYDLSRITFGLFVVAGTVFMGTLVRTQRQSAQVLAERNAELQRLREVEARQVVVQERTRIARELHDVVAHHVSAIVIRAQAASRLAENRPEVAAEATSWIAGAGQEALTAMRHTVRVLRNAGDDPALLAPQATLADVPAMVARLAGAGLHVDVDLPDPLPHLAPQVELAAVRIAQEALTNALRHAHADRAVIVAREVPTGLVIEVHDDGQAVAGATPPAQVEGHGLRGMAERAAACGGGLDVGRSELGGWRVTAFLPRPEHAALRARAS
jgi:signal transduction histidine kinase